MSYPLENMNNNGLLKKNIYRILGCNILGHSWSAPSTIPCIHRCEICGIEEKWCKQFKTIKTRNNKEEDECINCRGIEHVVNGIKI